MTAILIKSSKIYDGTGAPPFVSDILIKDDRIESISNIEPTSDHIVIESNGLAASPGFIDTHTHSDGALLNDPQHAQSLRQGVTTEILGQDGLSYAPLSKDNYLLNLMYLSAI